MGRPKLSPDKAQSAVQVGLKLTIRQNELLQKLVEIHNRELRETSGGQHREVTPVELIRMMIMTAAEREGLTNLNEEPAEAFDLHSATATKRPATTTPSKTRRTMKK